VLLDSERSFDMLVRRPLAASTTLYALDPSDLEFVNVAEQMQSTVKEHKDSVGGVFTRYNIVKVRSKDLCQMFYKSLLI